MSTASYEITNETALAWCKKLHEEGITLNMHWDGGGDSGWVEFQIDKSNLTEEDNEMIAYLENKCYDELDYGSWAGEFSATGDAAFDPEQNAFVGTDYYSEDESITKSCALRIAIPQQVWFDSVEIMVEDEEINVSVDIIVRNGFKTEAHTAAEEALVISIQDQVSDIVSDVQNFRSMWEEINLSKADFKLDGDEIVHIMNEISVGVYEEDEKGIFINLDNEE